MIKLYVCNQIRVVLDALPKNKLNRYYSIKGLQNVRTAQGKMGQNSKLRL